jgi:hypothetical protein
MNLLVKPNQKLKNAEIFFGREVLGAKIMSNTRLVVNKAMVPMAT